MGGQQIDRGASFVCGFDADILYFGRLSNSKRLDMISKRTQRPRPRAG